MKKQKAQEDISNLTEDQLFWRLAYIDDKESEEYERVHAKWWELESDKRDRIFGRGKYAIKKKENGGNINDFNYTIGNI